MSKQRIIVLPIAILAFVIVASGAVPLTTSTASAQDVHLKATLRDRLVYGLKARRPSEFQFIDAVVAQVDSGVIPERLVDETFFWVRKNKPNYSYPFIYFERILRLRGKAANIPIPPYNGPYSSNN